MSLISGFPFFPAKGSAAFTPTPTGTPIKERTNYHFSSNVSEATRGSRSVSADSNATLVDDDEALGVEPPMVDGCSRGIVAVPLAEASSSGSSLQWTMTDRELYHRLQNLADYPSAVAIARRRVLKETCHLLSNAEELAQDPLHIFSLSSKFDAEEFKDLLQRQHDATTKRFTAYSQRRSDAYETAKKAGKAHSEARKSGMEMFYGHRQGAKRWLRRSSVVKYVDGAWLSHLLRSTTGVEQASIARSESGSAQDQRKQAAWLEAQRTAAMSSWQVMSEELGDGDLSRSHVAIYEILMDKLATEDGVAPPPKGEDRSFTEWSGAAGPSSLHSNPPRKSSLATDAEGNQRCWRAAVAQLSLSVSPNEFLAESIGWNSSYEGLPYHLLVSARELQELDLDAYYFWLHISIDNADSGHSAMAAQAIVEFLEAAKTARGEAFADEMWARVKLGFALADAIPTTPLLHEEDVDDTPEDLTWTSITKEDVTSSAAESQEQQQRAAVRTDCRNRLIEIFRAKSHTAHGLHMAVKARLAGQPLSYWLDPAHNRIAELLDALADNPIWITRAQAKDSKFVREFEWGGKMFGALTGGEVDVLRRWVDTLEPSEAIPPSKSTEVCLLTDEEVEEGYRATISSWLGKQINGRTPTYQLASSSSLRTPVLPELLSHKLVRDWPSFAHQAAKPLYQAIMSRPDAVRPDLADLESLLKALDPTTETTSRLVSGCDVISALRSSGSAFEVEDNSSSLASLLPLLSNLTTALEQIVSLSPGRLASPLGMACIKYLRIMHGFTETSDPQQQLERGGDGRETGCMGTDDMRGEGLSWWDAAQALHRQLKANDGKDDALLLSKFVDRPGGQLALASLLLSLSSHFWICAPTLLGINLYLVEMVARHPVVTKNMAEALAQQQVEDVEQDLQPRLRSASSWLQRAISIGLELEQNSDGSLLPRGVTLAKGRTWSKDVERGWRIAAAGMRMTREGE